MAWARNSEQGHEQGGFGDIGITRRVRYIRRPDTETADGGPGGVHAIDQAMVAKGAFPRALRHGLIADAHRADIAVLQVPAGLVAQVHEPGTLALVTVCQGHRPVVTHLGLERTGLESYR